METAKPNGKVFDRSLHCARLHKPARVGFHDPCHGLKAVVGVLSAHLDYVCLDDNGGPELR